MRFIIFSHSLVSDWNHGNAHFIRGIALELLARNHELAVFEPEDAWSRAHLLQEAGQSAVDAFYQHFPTLRSEFYNERTLDLDIALAGADVVLVHEWNSASLIAAIGRHRSRKNYQLFFHDTHHRVVSNEAEMAAVDLKHYDGVLAYGNVIRDAYRHKPGVRDAFTWHEAADIRTFLPITGVAKRGDLVWIGNWGDGEREDSLREFLIEPVKKLGLKARVYGVRYPQRALNQLVEAGIEFGGWLPNYQAPHVFAQYKCTIHVPRKPYVESLPGIPTIRPFEALACGIPLVSAPWRDDEHLFTPGLDFLFAANGEGMTEALAHLLADDDLRSRLSARGLKTIRERHTCGHRVDELMTIAEALATVEISGGGG